MTPEEIAEIKQFNADRVTALSTGDRETIELFFLKYYKLRLSDSIRARNPGWTDADVTIALWGAVHKAITADTAFPHELRVASKAWLDKRKFHSYDDGDL